MKSNLQKGKRKIRSFEKEFRLEDSVRWESSFLLYPFDRVPDGAVGS